MKKLIRPASFIIALLIVVVSFSACAAKTQSRKIASDYIRVNQDSLSKGYIGYFFYVAQRNMLEEAGRTTGEGGNSTQEDIKTYWETTEIEGKSAVDVARELAADNAVMQKLQYQKAIEEKIELTKEEKDEIEAQISAAIENNGGEDKFNAMLQKMDSDRKSYHQILIENKYIEKLYDKYCSDGTIVVEEGELKQDVASAPSSGEVRVPDYTQKTLDSVRKEKFNTLAKQWEKNAEININDKKMKEFQV